MDDSVPPAQICLYWLVSIPFFDDVIFLKYTHRIIVNQNAFIQYIAWVNAVGDKVVEGGGAIESGMKDEGKAGPISE